MSYKPRVIDTSKVEMPTSLHDLLEHLSENVHDIWSRERFAEGWTFGEQRDDENKKHPCLVPYADLPESEKEYDRKTAAETIKAIMALGYKIEGPGAGDAGWPEREPADDELHTVRKFLENPSRFDLASSIELWRTHDASARPWDVPLYRALAQHILSLGEPLIAFDVAAEGVAVRPGDVRLRQLLALALLRSRATERAVSVLQELADEGVQDEETLGLLARAHKDLAEQSFDPDEKKKHWERSYKAYLAAFEKTRGYWTGINAATMAKILGAKDDAFSLALQVRDLCFEEIDASGENDTGLYWSAATVAESALIMEDWDEAEHWYADAACIGKKRYGDLGSTRRNARLLMRETRVAPIVVERIDACFKVPRVAVFAGHMIDRPGRAPARFPPQLEEEVKKSIRQRLQALDVNVGFASAACGSDILFLEALLEINGEVHIILPYEQEQFIKDSVDIREDGRWADRFRKVLDQAAEVLTASEQTLEGGYVPYDYANLLVLGLGRIRARQLETEFAPLAVWDNKPGDGPGGTASIVGYWLDAGFDVDVIDLEEISKGAMPLKVDAVRTETFGPPQNDVAEFEDFETKIKAMLFADAVGFSKLNNRQVAYFVKYFIGAVSDLMEKSPHAPLTRATWGDGLYFVFKNSTDAGRFSLDMADLVRDERWERMGLPEDLNLRIALHAGPVYKYVDPLTERVNYIGSHVTRAARIEPVTPPGQVYTSREFAAMAAAENVLDFTCDYIGLIPLAKKYGIIPMYHLRRTASGAPPRVRPRS